MDDSVVPLFPVPSCVLFGRKRAIGKATPATVLAYSGALPMRDASEELADFHLGVPKNISAPETAQREGGSPYRKSFRQGAILIPRMLVLIERRALGRLGANPEVPSVISRRSTLEKEPWASLPAIEGNAEKEFVRPVLLGESILPYRLFQPFEGVIPVGAKGRILNSAKAADAGFPNLSAWLEQAEQTWDRQGKGNRTFGEQLNYIGQLSAQFPMGKLRLVYAKAGSQPAACIIRDERAVIDHKLYWAQPASEQEAHYLCCLLNSEVTRARAEKYQARGQFGARDFDKVIWNLPIPRFDPKDKLHLKLAAAGAEAEGAALGVDLVEGEKFQRARKRVRDGLIALGIAARIDALVEKLLDGS